MHVHELFQLVETQQVDILMKEKWFPFLWESDDIHEAYADNHVHTTLFTLRNMKPNTDNTDVVLIHTDVEEDFTYRYISIMDEKGEGKGYLLRTWQDFLGLTISQESLNTYTYTEIAAILLRELQANQTEDEIQEVFTSLDDMFREGFYTGPVSVKNQQKAQEFSISKAFSPSLTLVDNKDTKK